MASYARVPGSDLVAGYETQSGLAVAYGYEAKRDLKTRVSNRFGGSVVSQYDYRYDAIGRRTSVENAGSAFAATRFTSWGYDDRNQVTASNRYTGSFNASPNPADEVANERRGFEYDPIGNRETALDQDGLTSISYTPNELNQYEAVGQQAPSYDLDGNLLNDGTKVLQYNAENQLISVTVPGVSVSTYLYDYIGRRVRKSVDVLHGSGSDYVVTWVYSGWNKIEERKTVGVTTTVKNFVWGLDLSQSMEGAGGIGGLIAVVDQSGSANLFSYDGNSNVSELVAAGTGSTSAHYEYDAFGNVIVTKGTAPAENAYRFSTKYADDETGLVYYGYRYYDSEFGRWTQRDPIGERGGVNLYGVLANNAISRIDPTGLRDYRIGLAAEPSVTFDEDFHYDRDAVATEYDLQYWRYFEHGSALLEAAGRLPDAVRAYRHYLYGKGADLKIDFEEAYKEDPAVEFDVDYVIEEAKNAAERVASETRANIFHMTSTAGASTAYPRTENWQKTIGAYQIWVDAEVRAVGCSFKMKVNVHEIDRYNFNRGDADIATNIPDDINGRFLQLGWAHSFTTRGTVVKSVTWNKAMPIDDE